MRLAKLRPSRRVCILADEWLWTGRAGAQRLGGCDDGVDRPGEVCGNDCEEAGRLVCYATGARTWLRLKRRRSGRVTGHDAMGDDDEAGHALGVLKL